MPTIRKMIVDFYKSEYRDKKEQELLVGEEEYSLRTFEVEKAGWMN